MSEIKHYDVICPYCCHKFHPNEAHFRLSQSFSPNYEDNETNNRQNSKTENKRVDQFLYEYNISIKQLSEQLAKKEAMQLPYVQIDYDGVSYSQDELNKYGFVQNITYKKNNKYQITDIRLCPNCHNILAKGSGLHKTILISIIGDARVGKSVYLTMLINELSNNSDYNSRLIFTGDKDSKDNFNRNYEEPLLKNKVLVNPTERKRLPPFGYNYWYQYRAKDGTIAENVIDLVFYDIAGEDLRDVESMRKNGFNIKDSSGLIYLVDPTNFKNISDIFRVKNKKLVDNVPKENSSKDIFAAMFNYFLGSDDEKSKIPIALVVSKSDLFLSFNFRYFKNRPFSRILNINDDEKHKGFLKTSANNALNAEVKEMLREFGENQILNNLQSNFKTISCFAVSSLGSNPVPEKEIDNGVECEHLHLDKEIIPFRVKDPFYWILVKNNLMYNYENNIYYKDCEKKELEKSKNVFTALIDFSKKLFKKKKYT